MEYELVKLDEFCGDKATIYSVVWEDDDLTLFDRFVEENFETYQSEVKNIVLKLEAIGQDVGAREGFFKLNEGQGGDLVCALYDEPDSQLRLYCIRFGNVAIIVGGGGPKSKAIKSWQESPKLTLEANRMIALSKDIYNRIRNKELKWSADGRELIEP